MLWCIFAPPNSQIGRNLPCYGCLVGTSATEHSWAEEPWVKLWFSDLDSTAHTALYLYQVRYYNLTLSFRTNHVFFIRVSILCPFFQHSLYYIWAKSTSASIVVFDLIFQHNYITKTVQGNTKWQRDIILNKIEEILLKRLVRLIMIFFLEWTAQVLLRFALTQATHYPVCSPSSYNGLNLTHVDTDAGTASSQEQTLKKKQH